jgi:hypothetical protein
MIEDFKNKTYIIESTPEQRVLNGHAFWYSLNREVEEMRLNRIRKELLRLYNESPIVTKFEDMPTKAKRHFRPKNVVNNRHILTPGFIKGDSLPIVKHDDLGNSFVDRIKPKKTTQKLKIKSNYVVAPVTQAQRQQLASVQKDIDVCFYCEVKLDFVTIDHIIPIWKGAPKKGNYNMVYACPLCNSWKSNHTLESFKFFILSGVHYIGRKKSRQIGEGQIAIMIKNVRALQHYRDSNPLMQNLLKRIK